MFGRALEELPEVVKMANSRRLLSLLLPLALLASLCSLTAAEQGHYVSKKSKIITFKAKISRKARRAIAKQAGCVIVRELKIINALECRPKGFKMKFGLGLIASSVERISPNEYRKWIESSPESLKAADLPSLKEAMKEAKEGAAPALGAGKAVKDDGAEDSAEPDEKFLWGLKRVKAPSMWEQAQGSGVRVAVIDTGVDYSHPDIAPNYAGGYNAVDPESDDAMDDHGHGTHVAGTIAAAGEKGVIGVAPQASLFGIKVLDANGGGTVAGIIEGIQWAIENEMDVINMSLGGPPSADLEAAVEKAYEAGITVVAASGNNPNAAVSAPACYDTTIAVSASAYDDTLAFFSTTGPEVTFIAPGHEIDSAYTGGGFARLSGTSMASPHVAGLAALAVNLGASGADSVRTKLLEAATPLEGLTSEQQGAGMIEADRWGRPLVAMH